MPLSPPDPPLSDGVVALRPLTGDDLPGFTALVADPEVRRFTRVPDVPPDGFPWQWLQRYIDGWGHGTLAGFAIGTEPDDRFAGFAGIVDYDEHAAEGELGYIISADARGHGLATRTLTLLADWALTKAGLRRAELIIDPENAGSLVVAQRAGFHEEGVRRDSWVKGDTRADVTIWSRVKADLDRR